MISIVSVQHLNEIREVEKLAKIIWEEHYTSIIGMEQVTFMLQQFQSENAIKSQIKEGFKYFLIFYNSQNIGYFSIQKKETTLFLSKLYVLKEFRGIGIGKKSIDFIVTKAVDIGCVVIALTVNKYNTNSIKAYEKMGFNIIDSVVNDIGNNFVMDDFVMEKRF